MGQQDGASVAIQLKGVAHVACMHMRSWKTLLLSRLGTPGQAIMLRVSLANELTYHKFVHKVANVKRTGAALHHI